MSAHSYGPRLARLVERCSGAYRLSKRRGASCCTNGLGVPLALGESCPVEQTGARTLDPAGQAARADVPRQDATVEEMPGRQQQRARLWGVVTQGGSVPALIDDDTYTRAQAQLARNSRLSFRHNTRHSYPLRCLLCCGLCSLNMFGRTYQATATSPEHHYYNCKGKDLIGSGRDQPYP